MSENYLKPDGSRYRSGTSMNTSKPSRRRKTGKPDVLVYRRKKPPDVNLDDSERDEKE